MTDDRAPTGWTTVNWSNLSARLVKSVYPRFGLRASDILLASFPKSGNTWLRFIWANMVSQMELGGREVTFGFLNNQLVAEYDSHSYGNVEFDCLPRLVKTHLAYDPRAFGKNRRVYLVRHPGDVVVSYFEYRRAQDGRDPSDSGLGVFLRDETYGVPAWCRHVDGWRRRADIVVKFEDLKLDAVAAVERILRRFTLQHVERPVVELAVERSSFDTLCEMEQHEPNVLPDRFDPEYRFMRKGTSGEWRKRFDDTDIDYLRSRVVSFGLDDLYPV